MKVCPALLLHLFATGQFSNLNFTRLYVEKTELLKVYSVILKYNVLHLLSSASPKFSIYLNMVNRAVAVELPIIGNVGA